MANLVVIIHPFILPKAAKPSPNVENIQAPATMARLSMEITVQNVQSTIRYRFKYPLLLWKAMQAAGSNILTISSRPLPEGNERLAIVSDAVLKLALTKLWYPTKPVMSK